METITKEYKVFKFEELAPDVQEKVIQKQREWTYENMDLDFFKEDAERRIENEGFENVKVYFDLSYSQGSGLCFEGSLNWDKFLQRNPHHYSEFKKGLKFLKELYISVCIKHSGNYYHSNSVSINVDIGDFPDNITEKQSKRIEELQEQIERVITDLKDELCKELEKQGYDEIEYQTSEQNVKEMIEVNDYRFDEDGKVF